MGRNRIQGVVLLCSALAIPLAAESTTYRVKFRFDGATGVYLSDPPGCPGTSRTGFDEFEGELSGDESRFATDQQVVYRGVMKRRTEIDACDLLPEDANGVAEYCNVHLVGGGDYSVELTIHDQRTEVYFQARPRKGKVSYHANGSCESEIVSDYEREFEEDGEGIEHWIGPRDYPRGAKVGGPPRAGIYRDQPPYPPHLAGHWTMTVGPPDTLRAEAGGPYRVVRGENVRLDGSRSQGQIQNYTWTLVAEPCPAYLPELVAEAPSRRTRDGVAVEFKALCPLTAKLVVSDGSGFEEDYTKVEIVPRAWTTKIEPPVKSRFTGNKLLWPCLHCQWGINLCAEEFAAGQMTSGHQIHSTSAGNWMGPKGFQVEPLHDPHGPWDGWWYVKNNNLRMQRAELVHQDLFPPSCAVEHSENFNQEAGATVCDLDLLRDAIAEHEHQHTRLLNEKLRESGVDPAPVIEAFVASSGRHDQLIAAANQRIGIADGELFPMTENDAEVSAAMSHAPYTSAGVIFLPKTAGACSDVDYDSYDIPSYAQMGVEGPP